MSTPEDSAVEEPPPADAADVESPALESEPEEEAAPESSEEEFIGEDVASPDLGAESAVDETPVAAEPVTAAETAPEPAPAPAAPRATDRIAMSERPRRRAKGEGDSWWELVKTVIYAVIIAVFVRTILFQPFNIPSASMENTLLIGDYLFVSKYSYGYSLYSLPWGYWLQRRMHLKGRLFGSEPERGDIVVFKFPTPEGEPRPGLPDDEVDYIKRLVGLPGDRIQMKAGVLYINDRPVPRVYVGDTVATINDSRRTVKAYRETLPNGTSYVTLDAGPDFPFDNTGVYVVPEGHYFMMGDNRDNSNDSREAVGYVPFENLIGRARFIWFSIDSSASWLEPWTWFSAIRYDRIATVVD